MEIEDIKKAILDDTQAFLMTEQVNVDAEIIESDDNKKYVKVGILIAGLSFSFTSEYDDLKISFEVALKMLQSQLVIYAIECLKNKHKAHIPAIHIPAMTHTLIKSSPMTAIEHYIELAGAVGSFNIFEGTYYQFTKGKAKKVK